MDFKVHSASFNSVCRICLKATDNLSSIFETILPRNSQNDDEKSTFASLFEKYCKIRIHHDDLKPQQICVACKSLALQCWDFLKTFLYSNSYLDELLLENENKPLIETIEKVELDLSECSLSNNDMGFDDTKTEIESKKKRATPRKRVLTQFKDGERFVCILCQEMFTDINIIIDHLENKHGNAKQCLICEKKIIKKPLLWYHMSQHSKNSVQCKPCRHYFRSEELKQEHLNKYDHTNPLVCHICGKKFALKGRRDKHMIAHYGKNQYQCSECGDSFIYKTSYIRHYRKHFGKEFLCYICGKEFTTNFNVQLHIKREHEGLKPDRAARRPEQKPRTYKKRVTMMEEVQCEYCDEILPSKPSYIRHRQNHPEFCDYPCKLCKAQFTTKIDLKEHMTVHNKFACSHCNKGFPFKCMLDMHYVNHKNLSLSKLSCSICELPQRNAKDLKTHMLIHTGEKPCVCEICGKSFRQPPHLTIHMYQHTGKKPHKCEVCGKSFTFRCNMVSHLRIHTVFHGVRFVFRRFARNMKRIQKMKIATFSISSDSVDTMCRVCLAEGVDTLTSIYEVNLMNNMEEGCAKSKEVDLVSLLQDYCNIKVHKNDGKPQKICAGCIDWVCQSYSFFLTFVRSNDILNEVLKHQKKNDDGTVDSDIKDIVVTDYADVNLGCGLADNENVGIVEYEEMEDESIIKDEVNNSGSSDEDTDRAELLSTEETYFLCSICSETFETIHKIIDHHYESHEDDPRCPICLSEDNTDNLKYHISLHSKSHSSCVRCLKYFSSKADFKRHLCHKKVRIGGKSNMGKKKSTPAGEFPCTICGKKYTTKLALRTHSHIAHQNLSKASGPPAGYKKGQYVQCDFCDKVITSIPAYKNHLSIHPEFTNYDCRFCNEVYSTRTEYREHLNVHKKYECEHCGKKFILKCDFIEHEQGHMDGKSNPGKFQCEVCGAAFKLKYSLHDHLLIHSQAKPHKCTICGKAFRQTSHLRIHRYQHNVVKPFKCDICDRRFVYKCNLVSHIRIHTGEKPYPCPYCEKWFRDSIMLHKHKKSKHPEMLLQNVDVSIKMDEGDNISDE
ncbi:zinc finger protein 26-like [Cylas formicarius]|uniref:zinc finger protein 26-like n=1 Tax=Cylas formicarius TaxID=197179 RepID=UPI0029584683|nr:zinc finger protein 26-like [Cylas formicarius]